MLYAFLFFVLGAILASFAGVIAERLHTGEAWTHGRSRCNACRRELTALDLVPIVSWLMTRGRCRTCRARVPAAYALMELALGAAFLAAYLRTGLSPALVPLLVALFILTAVVYYDVRHMIVPPELSLPLIIAACLYALLATGWGEALFTSACTAAAMAAAFLLIYFLSNGRLLGLGDAPVVFALALLAGNNALSGLVYSFWIGAGIGIIVLLGRPKGHRIGIEVPFVPFMAAGFLLALFTQWNVFPFVLF